MTSYPTFCLTWTLLCRAGRTLSILLVASLGAGWLSPAFAYSQTASEWNRVWCKATANCPSSYWTYLHYFQRVGHTSLSRAGSLGDFPLNRSAAGSRFNFWLPNTSGIANQEPVQRLLFGLPTTANRIPNPGITNDSWTGGAGNWSNASMWTAGVPNSSENALITSSTPSPVTLDIDGSAYDLQIGPKDSLSFNTGTSLSLSGNSISNNGEIVITGGNNANTLLNLGATTTLSGGGTVTLAYSGSGNGAAFIQQSAGGVTLINQETIQGTGIIGNGGLAVTNSSGGTIDANVSGAGLTLNGSGGVTNQGLLEATNGGVLAINTGVNNFTGSIAASGGTVQVSATIQGGTLNTSSGGTLETVGAATLDGSTDGALTLSKGSTYTGNPGTTTNVLGTITNNGTFDLIAGSNANTILGLSASTSLTGGGTVTLAYNHSGNGATYIQQNAGSLTLTNVDNTIQGTGVIGNGGLTLANQSKGTIDANTSGAGLTLNGSGGVTNTGLLEATNDGILGIATVVNNKNGIITANGGTVAVSSTIQGGTLNTLKGGTLETAGSAVLDGSTNGAITLSTGSTYTGNASTTTNVLGTITNNGTFDLIAGSNANTVFGLTGNTTLNGGGTETLAYNGSGNGVTIIQQNAGGLTLTNVDNTIQGTGVIGNGGLTLINQSKGTIDANTSGAGLTLNGGGGVTNTGLLEASGGGILGINTIINNAGGNITANGGTVEIYGATIQGGTLNNTGGGTLETPGGQGATLDGSTSSGAVTLNGTYSSLENSTTNLLGTINNKGTLLITGGSNANTVLGLSANTTLQSGGTVTLAYDGSGNGAAYVEQNAGGLTLTNVNNTIQGEGVIGNGGLTFVNDASGVVNANSAGSPVAGTLILNGSGGVTNLGLMEATNKSTLAINTTVDNAGGNITASGTGAVVVSGTIQGGTLNTTNGGSMETSGSATLDGITQGALTLSKGSVYTSNPGTTTNIVGTITDQGNIQVIGGSNANTILGLNGNTTLNGGGTVTLGSNGNGNGAAYIEQNAGGLTLTNQDTIQGAGVIGNGGLTLVNAAGGTLFANVSGQTLLVNGSGSITNKGTMRVASGATMHVTNGAFTNFSGTTLTGGTYNIAGTLEIDELGSTGGEIVTNAANIILNGSSSNFIDAGGQNALSKLAVNAKGSSFTIEGGRNFTTAGKFTNNGTLTVGSANSRFKVTGNLTNFSTTTDTLTGGTYNLTGTLQFKNANIVTNAANITLSGTASQIVDQHGNNGLANFATNNGSFTIKNGRNFTTASNFTNNGTLTVGSSNSTFVVNGNLTNFSGTTLTGGTYNLTGMLQFNGADIVTNAANITLNGTAAQIVDQNHNNGLANFATNNGSFTLAGGSSFTTTGSFANSGTFAINTGSAFTLGGSGAFTQSAGTTTDNGTLSAPGAVNIQAGSLFGTGSVTGNLQSSGIVTPGDSSTLTGILTDKGSYTQNSAGALDISIGGTTAGSQFDALNSNSASLNGTLNIGLINGFVPTIGSTFKIMNFSSETGTFSTVNGLGINNKEHFKLTYQGSDVLLTVVSGPLAAGQGGNFFLGNLGRQTMFGRVGLSGINSASRLSLMNSQLAMGTINLFHPGAISTFTTSFTRSGLASNFQPIAVGSHFSGLSPAVNHLLTIDPSHFAAVPSSLISKSSISAQAVGLIHPAFNLAAVTFAGVPSRLGNSFGTIPGVSSPSTFSVAAARITASLSSQRQSVASASNFGAIGGSATKGITSQASSLPRYGSKLSSMRGSDGSIRGGLAGHSFAVSMSNVMSKPKFGLGIQ